MGNFLHHDPAACIAGGRFADQLRRQEAMFGRAGMISRPLGIGEAYRYLASFGADAFKPMGFAVNTAPPPAGRYSIPIPEPKTEPRCTREQMRSFVCDQLSEAHDDAAWAAIGRYLARNLL